MNKELTYGTHRFTPVKPLGDNFNLMVEAILLMGEDALFTEMEEIIDPGKFATVERLLNFLRHNGYRVTVSVSEDARGWFAYVRTVVTIQGEPRMSSGNATEVSLLAALMKAVLIAHSCTATPNQYWRIRFEYNDDPSEAVMMEEAQDGRNIFDNPFES